MNQRLANLTPIYKKGCKEDVGNYKSVSLILMSGKVMEQIILSEITRYIGDNRVIRPAWVHEKQVLLDQPDLLL